MKEEKKSSKSLFSSIFSLLVKYTSLFKDDDDVFFDLVGEIEREDDDDTFYSSSSSFSVVVIAFEEARKRYSRKEEREDEEGEYADAFEEEKECFYDDFGVVKHGKRLRRIVLRRRRFPLRRFIFRDF